MNPEISQVLAGESEGQEACDAWVVANQERIDEVSDVSSL